MDWTQSFLNAIDYIEKNLLGNISVDDVASNCNISSFYFQKAFSVYTGYSVADYIRNRRLYCAALEIRSTDISIIDIAYKYRYETPEAFSKAFKRFHGVNPSFIRKHSFKIKMFLPLRISISIIGGNEMDYIIEKEQSLKFIGFSKIIKCGQGMEKCPEFWDEINEKYFAKMNDGSKISKAIIENIIGEYAVCIDNIGDGTFKYMVAGLYKGGNVPNGLEIIELKDYYWAKFSTIGPLPGSIQALTERIFKEWIPNNKEYKLSADITIEWYSCGNVLDTNYKTEVWLPVEKIN